VSEVSCRAFSFFLAAEARGLVSLDALLDGFPFSKAYLSNGSHRVPWDAWSELCDRFGLAVHGDDALLDSGDLVLSEGFAGYLGTAVGLLADSRELYELSARWVGPSLYRALTFDVTPIAGVRTLVWAARLKPGYRPSRAFFLMTQSALATVPAFMGLPRAVVEPVERSEHALIAKVTPPPAPLARSWVRRVASAFTTPGAIVRELTAQQEQLSSAFDEMRRSTRAFRDTLDALPYLVAVHDKGTDLARIRYANPAFGSFFGRSPDSLVGVELASLFPEGERPRPGAWLDQTPRTIVVQREGRRFELEVRSVDGIEFSGHEAAVFLARDLTEAREAQARIERTEAAMVGLLDAFPDLVLRFDGNNVLRSVHGVGGPEVELVRQRIGQLAPEVLRLFTWVDPALNAQAQADFEEAFRSRRTVSRAITLPAPDGAPRDLLVRYAPIGGELVIIIQDETERRHVARRLQVSERMASLGSLAAGVAHEINNPLTWVLTNLDVLEAQLEVGAPGVDALEIVREVIDGARRIRDTVAGMKDFSRVSKRAPALVDVAPVIEKAGRMAQHELKHCARLVLELSPAPRVLVDETELGLVFVNLLVNAGQAMPPGATPQTHRVTVTLGARDDRVVATVTDTGTGIPPEVADRLFEPFVTSKQPGRGTGLGLAISRRIVDEAGGQLSVVSVPGRTTFTIDLPAAPEDVARPEATVQARPSRPLLVGVIDDEPMVVTSLRRLLPDHRVLAYASVDAAVAALVGEPLPDVVLCDVMMPGLNGIDVAEQLASRRPEARARLVFMSGGAFTPRVQRFFETSTTRVLRRPFEANELLAVLAEVERSTT
jgi:PAS domain S-box-containing protein